MGPAVASLDKILQLIDAGMNVARINFSHGTQAEHRLVIQWLKEARQQCKCPLAIMLDTKGPEIRVGKIKGGQIAFEAQQKVLLVKEDTEGTHEKIQIIPGMVLDSVKVGTTILFDDGYISSIVLEKSARGILVEIQNPGVLKSQKGVNIPHTPIELPAMTKQDIDDIIFGCKEDVDIIAASFIRSAEHVLEIKRLLIEQGKSDILVMAKIENSLGVENIDSIIQVADGIMVARGDLGVELPLKQVPVLQKMMIRKCYQACKPVVTATQMLESMIQNPRPTRAEVSDVANAIYDGTSAVMLSGETAVGKYPVETVAMMRSIVQEAEKDFDYRDFFEHASKKDYPDISSSVALATVKTAYSANAQAIFAFTNSGSTARLLSRFRPKIPLIALTPNPKIYHQLASNWGVIPVDPTDCKNVQQAFETVSCFALKKGIVQYGDLVVVTAGTPFGITGTTNTMVVESIGDVVVRGIPGFGTRIHGRVVVVRSAEEQRQKNTNDCIVVIARCNDSYLPLLKHCLGIVLQNEPEDEASEKHAFLVAKTLDISIVVRAAGAINLLKDGQQVTLDPQKGIVYKGSIGSNEEMIPLMCPSP